MALTLHEAAVILGSHRWIEMRTFEILGSWVPTLPELDIKLAVAAQSYHHAWHAELWEDRLPVLAGIDPDELTAPATPGLEMLVTALADVTLPTIDKLVGMYRVLLPRKISAYRAHRARTSAVADGAVIRALDLALRDEVADWQEGEGFLQSLLASPSEVKRAAGRQAELESMLIVG